MIVLPKYPRPNRMGFDLLDFGVVQKGVKSFDVDRPGTRYRMTFSWPEEAMEAETAARFTGKLKRGKHEGVQMDILLPRTQGSPGSPVVDGAGQSGTTINVRGLTPGYAVKEDYYLTIVDSDGAAYLHSVFESTKANASGEASLLINEPLRAPFEDGDTIELSRPYIQGELVGETLSHQYKEQRRSPLTVTIEEYE